MKNEKTMYGGQAVIEGVMFGGKHHFVTAIRRKDNSIDFFQLPRKKHPILSRFKKIPFIRGIAAIIEASANGSKHLSYSSDRYDVDPADDEKLLSEEKRV